MSKFHLFVTLFSFTFLLVMTDVLTNGHLRNSENRKELGTTISHIGTDTKEVDSSKNSAKKQPALTATEADTSLITVSEEKITFPLLVKIGLSNVVLARLPFQGIPFESIDLRDMKDITVVTYNILEGNRTRLATFYEFQTNNSELARELYGLIRQKAMVLPDAPINETNAFGEASFYINYKQRTPSTFLVVNLQGNVYALTYQKDLHPYIKKLITHLSS